MKTLFLSFLLLNTFSVMALSERAVLRLVKDEISNGRLIGGKKYVEELSIRECDEKNCTLDFQYFASGCAYDYCYDLSCEGEIVFDLEEATSRVQNQLCVDL